MNNAAEMMENIHMIYSHVQKGNIWLTLHCSFFEVKRIKYAIKRLFQQKSWNFEKIFVKEDPKRSANRQNCYKIFY